MSKTAPNNALSSPQQGQLVLYITVTITGAAVMILELLGTRRIGPVRNGIVTVVKAEDSMM